MVYILTTIAITISDTDTDPDSDFYFMRRNCMLQFLHAAALNAILLLPLRIALVVVVVAADVVVFVSFL